MGEELERITNTETVYQRVRVAIYPFDLYDEEGNKLATGVARSQRFLRLPKAGPRVGLFRSETRGIELLEESGTDLYRTGTFAFAELEDLNFCSILS